MNELLSNHWYLALPTNKLKKNKMLSLEIFAEPVLFFRKSNNEVSAIRDICPHRGIPLKYGQMVHDMVECPYHGWKFDGAGVCREIPSLTSEQKLDCSKIKIKSYPVKEQFGGIWIFIGDSAHDNGPQPPVLEGFSLDVQPQICQVAEFDCHIDHAVIGLMDPAHGPYIHQSWFWRSSKSAYEKHKKFGPVDYGFRMQRHQPSKNSKAYKLLGGDPTTEITFTLPANRIEHIKVGKRNFFALSGLMPISQNRTQIIQMSFWDIPWLSLAKPLVKSFSHAFLGQDIAAVSKQQEGLKYDPSLMLIHDADTQAKWYYALKKEWIEFNQLQSKALNKTVTSNEVKRVFQNPVRDTVLSWKS